MHVHTVSDEDYRAFFALFVANGITGVREMWGSRDVYQALRAATLGPAQFLGASDSLGTVAPGKVADLVLLDGDPLLDTQATARIAAVVLNGGYIGRATLDTLLAIKRQPVATSDSRWRIDSRPLTDGIDLVITDPHQPERPIDAEAPDPACDDVAAAIGPHPGTAVRA